METRIFGLLAATLVAVISSICATPLTAAAQTTDTQVIRQTVLEREPQLLINKIALSNGYALVGYTHGDSGGVRLLEEKNNQWIVIAGGGGAYGRKELMSYGLPKITAENLLSKFDPNWRKWDIW
ncbi:MAG: hypothetical protein WAJ85_05220 [Candidatus Baltobacteraceae bacterium]